MFLKAEALSAKERFLFIDLYKTAVILLMLEGHVFRALLSGQLQKTGLFQIHEFIHGLTAPAFLFGAGLTFVISTRKRWEAYHHWDKPLARRVKKLLFVILLGFFLHLPFLSFRKIVMEGTFKDYLQLFQCDVLHCIGIGLLSLHLLIYLFKKEARFYIMVMVNTFLVCFLTPLIWDINFMKLVPLPVAQLFNGNYGSPFPLFPYVGFLYGGVIVSWEFLISYEKGDVSKFVYKLAVIGAVAVIAGYLFDIIPINVYPTYNYWFTSPNYFLVRIGSVMILISAFWYFSVKITNYNRIITVLGVESLFVYVLHLLILYGSVINPQFNLVALLGKDFMIHQTLFVFFIFLFFLIIVALLWNYLKNKKPDIYRIIQLSVAGLILILFFTLDY